VKGVAGLLVGLGAAALVLGTDLVSGAVAAGSGLNPLQTIELKTYDWRLTRTARPETARQDIALIEIDEYSLRNLEPYAGRWPWPRVVHAMLLEYLARAPAKLIVYDVNFAEADTRTGFDYGGDTWSGAASDQALVKAVRAAGNVILLADATYNSLSGESPEMGDTGFAATAPGAVQRRVVYPPFAALAQAGSALGHNFFVLDPDGPLRHTVPLAQSGTHVLPSLGLAAAIKAAGIAPGDVRFDGNGNRLVMRDRVMPLSWRRVKTSDGAESYQWGLINFRGPALLADLKQRTYPTYSFFDLAAAEQEILNDRKPAIDPALFRDLIVFVGTTASGLYDVFETPFSNGRMPGLNIHAAVADDVLSNRFIRETSGRVRIATVIAAAVAVGLVATFLPAWWATVATAVFIAVVSWIATRLFSGGYWLNLSQPVLASSFALFGGVGYQYFVEGRETRKMKKLFGQYVSKDVYEQLVANPGLARLGGHRRDMTVLFSDIRGFTTVTERGQPEEIVGMLNEYFTRMVAIVFRHHGTLDKFVGDMVMALFGAPLDDPSHADHAVEAALEMLDALHELNTRWRAAGHPELDIGIGINTGSMIAGNIGSEAIMSYTVIGDAVNLGSRLESLNKEYSTRIIISKTTRDRLSGRYCFRPLGDVVVKGKTQPVAIFELTGRGDALPPAAGDEARK
jgi:adenylate cyclase